ncbi:MULTISPECIES: hypothetical protein [unclassified Paraburkholderia]|uniref:hypothetical protein n=1 Tax=unclassified Paraburkholderia TaxID=2615204 RepID=UPI002AB2C582|nr:MULTISPECIES: hypothetical protein [unclassified Paraburkholderia]
MTHFQGLVSAILVASFYSLSAFSQTGAPLAYSVASNDQYQASDKATAKAEHKRKRREARAKKNAELKRLESNGYRPSQSGPGYPENLQKAQRRSEETVGPTK